MRAGLRRPVSTAHGECVRFQFPIITSLVTPSQELVTPLHLPGFPARAGLWHPVPGEMHHRQHLLRQGHHHHAGKPVSFDVAHLGTMLTATSVGCVTHAEWKPREPPPPPELTVRALSSLLLVNA